METQRMEKEILNLEKKYWQAMKDEDFDVLVELSDDPCLVTGAQGFNAFTRAQMSEMMKKANYKLLDYKIQDNAKVMMLNDFTAVVAYKVHEELDVEGQSISLDCAEASTWTRKNGKWVCSLHSEAISGDAFGRDIKRN